MTQYDTARLVSKLESAISGDVGSSPHHARYYSVDSSSYAVSPDVVVTPRNVDDVSAAVRIAADVGAPITARGGGTGLVGGALNRGIILDMREHQTGSEPCTARSNRRLSRGRGRRHQGEAR